MPINGALRPVYFRPQDGKPLYGEAIKNMSAQYQVMRDKLIQIEAAVKAGGDIGYLADGAELIPAPASFIKKGKGSRPLMMQYLLPRAKKEYGE